MIGKPVSHYRIIEEIGRGGMGMVYKAEDTKLKRTVALKFLPPELTRDPQAKARFIHEAQAASVLQHHNICTIHDIDETPDGQLFIVMDYYQGETLKDRINVGESPAGAIPVIALPIDKCINIAIQIAEGLVKAHEKGIIHRDIKPANILITSDGVVKILDFGLAKLAGHSVLTKTGTTVGTVAYMSPEQAQGGKVDQRSDIWSVGVVLYEMITGQRPFRTEYEHALIYMIINEEPEPIEKQTPGIPVEVIRIVNRALKKNPDERYSSVSDMLDDLKKCLSYPHTGERPSFNIHTFLSSIKKPRIIIPLVMTVTLIALITSWFINYRVKIRWAREVALPEIEKMIMENDAWRNLIPPYRLAEKAENILGNNPKLTGLFSKCALNINIRTEPADVKVYIKEYDLPDSEWSFLGITPIEQIRLPIGIFRWKFEKEGYERVLAAASSWDMGGQTGQPGTVVPYTLFRTMDRIGSIPPGMVRVQGAETKIGKIDDFYIDRFEITNKQFKEFVIHGGYKKREYWKYKFVKDGKDLIWEDAVKEFVDQTGQLGPSTWYAGDYLEGQEGYPVSGVSWYEAAAYTEYAGKSLPTIVHWGTARGQYTPMIRVYQLGGFAVLAPFSNFQGKGLVTVGSLNGITPYGAYDMAGNVREWCWNETPTGRAIRGGAWDDNIYDFGAVRQAPPMDRSPNNGFRGALYPDAEKIPEFAFQFENLVEPKDYYKETPVPDAVFQIYREQFSYDKKELNAQIESRQENPGGWIHEKITFDAAYGGERIIAHLFLPVNTPPSYQTVIYFPGSASLAKKSSADIENYYEFPMFLSFIVKNKRAVLYPVYKGTFERGDPAFISLHMGADSYAYTEFLVQIIKDFRRCIDYLETRPDIDSKNIAYYGMSWGGGLGAIIPAVEDRIKTSILVGGSLYRGGRPEAYLLNYVTRVKKPTLMLNGRYDAGLEIRIKPMFELLGTPPQHKKLTLYDTDHIPPRQEFIKEILRWLDKYLGPVN